MEERMAQTVEIWSACRPIVSKHWTNNRKSCLSSFPFSSQDPPWQTEGGRSNLFSSTVCSLNPGQGNTWDVQGFVSTNGFYSFDPTDSTNWGLLGWGSSMSLLPAAPVYPSRSSLPAAHRTHGNSSPRWPDDNTVKVWWTKSLIQYRLRLGVIRTQSSHLEDNSWLFKEELWHWSPHHHTNVDL